MEPLNEELITKLEGYGYPLIRSKKKPPDRLILDLIKSRDPRLLYSLPVIIRNITTKQLNLKNLEKILESEGIDKKIIQELLYLCLLVYDLYNIEPLWRRKLKTYLRDVINSKYLSDLRERFFRSSDIEIKNKEFYIRINTESFKDNFSNYLLIDKARERKKLSESIGFSLELKTHSQISKLFSKKQKEIILKKLKYEELTKTEKEYFSRSIKPKLEAILNPEIHKIGVLLI